MDANSTGLQHLFDELRGYAPEGWARIEVDWYWWIFGGGEGPGIHFIRPDSTPFPWANEIPRERYGSLGDELGKASFQVDSFVDAERPVLDGGNEANRFCWRIFPDGRAESAWTHDGERARQDEAEYRRLIGDEKFEEDRKIFQDAKERRAHAKALKEGTAMPDEDAASSLADISEESYSEAQLLGIIADAVRDAAADLCQEFVVDVEVHQEPGRRRQLAAHFWARRPSGKLDTVRVDDAIAVMNAAAILQGQLFEDEENPVPWHRLRIFCERGSNSVELEFDPDEDPE